MSDAALLYRRELKLDVNKSVMAVVVQQLVAKDRSGVGFGIDPRAPGEDRQVIEAVPGLCRDLVDGAVDPDRWLVESSSGEILEWLPGKRSERPENALLDGEDSAGSTVRSTASKSDIYGFVRERQSYASCVTGSSMI